ncbi:MAG: polysaccharide biosynthesis protein [Clostridia bacterium]|nr:polysaccharide biosynthesis protein [Clostridia bacterium]
MKTFKRVRNRYLFVMDIVLTIAAFAAMSFFVFPADTLWEHLWGGNTMIIATAWAYIVALTLFSIYKTDWVRAAHRDYTRLLFACLTASVISIICGEFFSTEVFFLKFNIAANIAVSTLICALRFLQRLMYKAAHEYYVEGGKKVLIIGAGRLALVLMREILENHRLNYQVVGLIDDDRQKRGSHMYGTKVLGNRNDIARICELMYVDEIIFAIHTIDSKQKAEILDICSSTGKKVKILPAVADTLTADNKLKKIREINIEDLLEREPIVLENKLLEDDICGKTILVTGGGGSIGSELCRQIAKFRPKRLMVLDIYENTTYELQNELEKTFPDLDIVVLIASVRDQARLEEIFDKYRPEIVFHAAAHKHVPLMEFSPAEAIKNNVFGTYNTAKASARYGVKRFVMISTDKAVNPTNIMGATKRMCEMIVQTLQNTAKTGFVAVRFGNVLGSHGSVVPRFAKQIAEGGPVTVTHPEITRFFMTISEAAQLVLQAGAYAKGGEIFVLDMGYPVKIYDLARKMISLSGYRPDLDIKIEFTGLRPGEKLYEELLMDEEGLQKTAHSKIFVGKPIEITPEELDAKLEKLKTALSMTTDDIKAVMMEVVPTYTGDLQDQEMSKLNV